MNTNNDVTQPLWLTNLSLEAQEDAFGGECDLRNSTVRSRHVGVDNIALREEAIQTYYKISVIIIAMALLIISHCTVFGTLWLQHTTWPRT